MQIGHGKQGVIICEYGPTESLESPDDGNAVIGYVEPACDNPRWILWFTKKGDALLYRDREPTGGVIGEPIRVSAIGASPR